MGEGIGKASKATIYLESILSPSQAEKSLTALVIWYKTLNAPGEHSGEFPGRMELFSSGFRLNPTLLLTLEQPSSSGMDYCTLHNQLNAPQKKITSVPNTVLCQIISV